MATEYKLSYTASDINKRLGMVDNMVKSVNGVMPDESGNVAIADDSKSKLDVFIDNTDINYAYDGDTGAYYNVIRIYRNKLDGTKQYPFVYAPNGANAGTQSTLDMVKSTGGWLLAINAGIFYTEAPNAKKPDGIIVENGGVIQNAVSVTHGQCKPLTIDSDGNLGYAEHDADAAELVANGIVSAVCGFMPIIVDYAIVPESDWNSVEHYTENAQRQIIGQWGNGDYAIVTCEGRDYHGSDGWTIAEAQTICEKLGLKFAYNLDGGGSTETMLGLKHINTIYDGTTGRKVPTFIVFNGTDNFAGGASKPDEDTPAYVNQVLSSIDEDGAIYNGIGYKNGYRISSSGTEKVAGNATSIGYIKVNPGDVIRFTGWPYEVPMSDNAIAVYSELGTLIGQFTNQPANNGIFASDYSAYAASSITEENGVWSWVVPPAESGVRYIRLSGCDSENGAPGEKMIVTVNEEIV